MVEMKDSRYTHLAWSILKSCIRIVSCIILSFCIIGNLIVLGLLIFCIGFIIAEILGIVEEI